MAVVAASLAVLGWSTPAAAAPPVRLHIAEESTCEGTQGLATRLAGKGIVVASGDTSGAAVEVDVRATTTSSGAQVELILRAAGRTATRSLSAPTCDEVLDALVFTLGLALEQPIEDDVPAPKPLPLPIEPPAPTPPVVEPPPPPPPTPAETPDPPLAWGGGASAGIFVGASSAAAAAVVVHLDVESRAPRLFAPSLILGGAFVLPSSTSAAGADVAFALQTGLLDACPVRIGGERLAIRPCLELQAGRLQARSAGFTSARLESSPWLALALSLRGRAELAEIVRGLYLEVDFAAGSPLIQEVFSVGDQRVLAIGPVLISATAGLGVHFP